MAFFANSKMADLSINLVPTTDIEAVNGMLALIGEAPVSNILDTGSSDVNLATQCIRNVSRSFQSRGWSFNVDSEMPMVRDSSGNLNVPSNAIVAAISKSQGRNGVQRGARMWDLDNFTFAWDSDLNMDFVWFMAFNDLPEHARYHIYSSAALLYARSQMCTPIIVQNAQQEEARARTIFKQVEHRIAPQNVYRSGTLALDLLREPNYVYIPGR